MVNNYSIVLTCIHINVFIYIYSLIFFFLYLHCKCHVFTCVYNFFVFSYREDIKQVEFYHISNW